MIKIEEIEITGNGRTISYYKSLGYDIRCNEKITVKIEHLIKTSTINITCYCDDCGSEFNIKYFNYTGNIKRNGLYRCVKCSKLIGTEKMKETYKKNLDDILSRTRKTNIEKYGVDSYLKTESCRTKLKEHCLLNYGVDNPMKSEEIKERGKSTNLIKYGVENPFQSNEIKQRISSGYMDKYGVDCYVKTDECKDKIRKSFIEKYGVEHPMHLDMIRQKIKKSNLEKYGVEYPMQNLEIFNKTQLSSFRTRKHDILDITYQGTYELDFINFLILKSIPFEKGPTIDYILDGINRKYHSDFYIPSINLICEVKSNWTYRRDIIENETKKEFSLKYGYNFLFIMDKDYSELIEKFL